MGSWGRTSELGLWDFHSSAAVEGREDPGLTEGEVPNMASFSQGWPYVSTAHLRPLTGPRWPGPCSFSDAFMVGRGAPGHTAHDRLGRSCVLR
jgi:hypothetical protein